MNQPVPKKRRPEGNLSFVLPYIEGDSALDIGAAEGWASALIKQNDPRRFVQLLDVVDLNRTCLPLQIYDGALIPFAENRFDTVLALLALHHCDDPERVLSEAARVARKRLIVTESVYRFTVGRWILWLLDTLYNTLRSNGQMPRAPHFKTIPQWRDLFLRHRCTIKRQIWISKGIHRHVMFILDPPPQATADHEPGK